MKYTKTNSVLQVQLQKAKRRCLGRFNRKLKDLDKKKGNGKGRRKKA